MGKYFFMIVRTFKEIADERSLDWSFLDKTSSADHDDELVKIYTSCLRETDASFPTEHLENAYLGVLKALVPRKSPQAQKDFRMLSRVFHRQELGNANVSEAIWQKICSYYRQYEPTQSVHFHCRAKWDWKEFLNPIDC